MRTLVWLRGKDLRLHDHPPLWEAIEAGEVITLFVLDPYFFAPARAEALRPRIDQLLRRLRALGADIAARGGALIVREGRSVDLIPELARAWEVDRVAAHRWSEPFGRERDRRVAEGLGAIPLRLYEGETLTPPGTIRAQSTGEPYKRFSLFARAFERSVEVAAPLPAPEQIPPPPIPLEPWAKAASQEGATRRSVGERATRLRLERFIERRLERYAETRDDLGLDRTSRLSADLKFGGLSIREVYHRTKRHDVFRRELLWREFAHHTLYERPDLLIRPLQAKFEGFPWRGEGLEVEAWRAGRTGYPIVDAAARQLLAEGFVHNRARMISASFLSKHLRVDYRLGQAHYARHLIDGDWANNAFNWQWVAGCGYDAQPYFRVFNPIAQAQRFDPEGRYVRRYCPELASMPTQHIHAPWDAPPEILEAAGVRLGEGYPAPIVEHRAAREAYLEIARGHLKGN